mmetsp:Transcript_29668/g.62930  ORF Transcript_29668/g.62930 Transcript_29668/m.62930 type:complete len:124 (-) Transcript_29668:537-908(-)
MVVLRPTGPITAFMIDLYMLSADIGVEYYSLLSWVGMWVGSALILIASFDLCRYIVLCTRFLHDIYAVFVCTIYITDGMPESSNVFPKLTGTRLFLHSILRYSVFHLAWVSTITHCSVALYWN